jgi:putative hemin transport protein
MNSPMQRERTPGFIPPQENPALAELERAWRRLLAAEPKIRIREAAARLAVPELRLLTLHCGRSVIRLRPDWGRLLGEARRLGTVLALTRNDHAVHENYGNYPKGSIGSGAARLSGDGFELSLALERCSSAFAVTEEGAGGPRRSLQFFDRHGDAAHKIYLTAGSRSEVYRNLVANCASADQSRRQAILPRTVTKRRPATDTDRLQLVRQWRGLWDESGFLPLLERLELDEVQALEMADDDLARPVANDSVGHILQLASNLGIALRIAVANGAAEQACSGPIHNIRRTGPWLNVLDEGFNLHLREERIDSSWVIRLPLADSGVAASLATFDAGGNPIARFFSADRSGCGETWKDLLGALPSRQEQR